MGGPPTVTHYLTCSCHIGIDMMVNVQKTVAMVFSPKRKATVVAKEFPLFKVDDECIQ